MSGGPTHASNLKCLCRYHYFQKAFMGWAYMSTPARMDEPIGSSPTLYR